MLALRGSNGVGFRVGLLIVRQPVDGTPSLSNTVYMQSKSMSRSSRAGETVPFFKYTDFCNRKTTFSSQIATWPALALGSRISLLENRISLLDAYTKILK